MDNNINLSREELEDLLEHAATRALEKYESGKKGVFLSRDEVSRRLQVDKSTLWRWDRKGYLKATRIGAKCVYSEDVVIKLEKNDKSA